MKVTTERQENCQINVIIEMDADQVDKALRQTARKISRQFNVPGYRRGKAPFHAVMRVFGRDAVQQETLEEFGNQWYEEAMEQVEEELYEAGDLQDVEWDPFRMTVLVPIKPEVDLGDYRSVRVPFEPEVVGEEEIQEYLGTVQDEHAQWVPVEREAQMGDQVVFDAEGRTDDELVLMYSEHEMVLEPEAGFPMLGMNEEMVGMAPGEEKAFALTVPEGYFVEDAVGKEANITVTLHTVKEKDVPPLDDDLAMMVGDYDSLDDLRASAQEMLESQAEQKSEAEYLESVFEAMIESTTRLEFPPQAVNNEAELAMNQMERNLASSGLELDTYLGMVGKTREGYKAELRPTAEIRLKKRLVLEAISDSEALSIEDEEIDAELERMAEAMGDDENMIEMFRSPSGRMMISSDLLVNKAQERMMQIAKGEAPPLAEPSDDEEEPVAAEVPIEAGGESEVEQNTAEPEVPSPDADSGSESTDEGAADQQENETD